MSDEDALLAAILADPDEDTPRLAYADWLDEHGRPDRAEFIRLQCPTGGAADDPSAEDRAAELEERNRGRWLAGLPSFADAQWEFRRGFPEILSLDGGLMVERYDAFARVPWARCVSLEDVQNWIVRDLTTRTWNRSWVELELRRHHPEAPAHMDGYNTTPAVAALANCPQVRQLRNLRFALFEIVPAGVRALASSPYLGDLRELCLEGDPGSALFAPLRERFGDRLVVERV